MVDIFEIQNKIKYEGNQKQFNYKGFKCEIRRHLNYLHLCGYITGEFEDKDIDIINYNFHGGITYDKNGTLGFDCNHTGDLAPNKYMPNSEYYGMTSSFGYETYKDMDYVENILKDTIDELMKAREVENENE